MKKVCVLVLSILTAIGTAAADSAWAAQTSVHLYSWYDFIAPRTPKAFQKETGTRAALDIFDNAEIAQDKLMVGRFGYDAAVIISNTLPGLIKAGVLRELDRDRPPHWESLDADVLGKLQANDPGNCYAVPYLWGTTGVVYDMDKVRKLLGPDASVDSWDLAFEEENISRFSQCGVTTLGSSTKLVSIVLNYLDLPHNSQNPEDYQKVQGLLLRVHPYIRYSDSSRVDTNLSNSSVCVVVGWQGTACMTQVNDEQAGNGCHIAYSIPREGSLVQTENTVLLRDVPYPQQGYALIDYLLRSEVIARASSYMNYPNGNQVMLSLVERELWENLVVYLSKETMATLFPLETLPLKIEGIRTRVWSRTKTGNRNPSGTLLGVRERPEPEKSSEARQGRHSHPSPDEALPRPSGHGLPSNPRPIDRGTFPPGWESPEYAQWRKSRSSISAPGC